MSGKQERFRRFARLQRRLDRRAEVRVKRFIYLSITDPTGDHEDVLWLHVPPYQTAVHDFLMVAGSTSELVDGYRFHRISVDRFQCQIRMSHKAIEILRQVLIRSPKSCK